MLNPSSDAHAATIAPLGEALTVTAFDSFRDAAHRAGLPLAVVNAFADYKSAVDFLLQAVEADAAGNAPEAEKLVGWSRNALAGMERELSALTMAAVTLG
jgi:hypothetical protein